MGKRANFLGAVMGLRERLDRAAEMPHRKPAGDNRLDARLSSELGRLFFSGEISEAEYEAGVKYAKLGLEYLESTDAPKPYGGELYSDNGMPTGIIPVSDDECLRRKIDFMAAKKVLKPVGKRCEIVVDRVCIYDEPIRDDLERHALRAGLKALCGH